MAVEKVGALAFSIHVTTDRRVVEKAGNTMAAFLAAVESLTDEGLIPFETLGEVGDEDWWEIGDEITEVADDEETDDDDTEEPDDDED
jgi:coenzyme F420-reducing hydrogenase alpha subunit